jgi:hypothetical protein
MFPDTGSHSDDIAMGKPGKFLPDNRIVVSSIILTALWIEGDERLRNVFGCRNLK